MTKPRQQFDERKGSKTNRHRNRATHCGEEIKEPETEYGSRNAGLAKFDWKVVAQWATKDINLVAQQ